MPYINIFFSFKYKVIFNWSRIIRRYKKSQKTKKYQIKNLCNFCFYSNVFFFSISINWYNKNCFLVILIVQILTFHKFSKLERNYLILYGKIDVTFATETIYLILKNGIGDLIGSYI